MESNDVAVSKGKRRKQDVILQEKQMSVNEKIAQGQKLTTEDLLAFQKMDFKK